MRPALVTVMVAILVKDFILWFLQSASSVRRECSSDTHSSFNTSSGLLV